MLCPRCQEPFATGQEYCLECGARLDGGSRGTGSILGSGWALRASRRRSRRARRRRCRDRRDGCRRRRPEDRHGDRRISRPRRSPTTGDASQGALGGADWPAGQDGWTVALAALPQTGGPQARARACRAARAKKLPQVGILDSSRYASLHPGYWIVFSGVYASEAEATSALDDARRVSRTAAVRHVIP